MNWKWPKLTLKDEPSPMQNVEFRRQKQFNWDALRGWALGLFEGFTDYSDSLDAKMTDFDNRFDDQMIAATDGDKDLSEVVDARRPTGGDAFKTLGKRLDFQDKSMGLADAPVYNTLSMVRNMRHFRPLSDGYSFMQGGCYIGDGKVIYAIINAVTPDDRAILIELDSDGKELRRSDPLMLGHANWISYDSTTSELYIAELETHDATGAAMMSHVISVVDYSTLTFKSSITIDGLTELQGIMSYSIDAVTGERIILTQGGGDKLNLYSVGDDQTLTEIKMKISDTTRASAGVQGVLSYGGYRYLLTFNARALTIMDKTGATISVLAIPNQSGTGALIGEVQWISPVTDNESPTDFMIGSVCQNSNFGLDHVTSVYKTNIVTGVADKPTIPLLVNQTVYVDAGSNSVNPDGSKDNPFKDINEALSLTNNPLYKNLTILLADGTYPFVAYYDPTSFVQIQGVNGPTNHVTIQGIRMRCVRAKLSYLSVEFYPTLVSGSPDQTTDISLVQSDVILSSINCIGSHDYSIYAYNSTINMIPGTITPKYAGTQATVDLEGNSHLIAEPYTVPSIYSVSDSVITPAEFRLTQLSMSKVGDKYEFTIPQQNTLKATRGVMLRWTFEGNVHYDRFRYGNIDNSDSSISFSSIGVANTETNPIALHIGEIGLTFNSTSLTLSRITTGSVSAQIGNPGIMGWSDTNEDVLIDQIWCLS